MSATMLKEDMCPEPKTHKDVGPGDARCTDPLTHLLLVPVCPTGLKKRQRKGMYSEDSSPTKHSRYACILLL